MHVFYGFFLIEAKFPSETILSCALADSPENAAVAKATEDIPRKFLRGGFLADIVAHQPCGKEIHVIADNLSAHKSQPVKDFLENHPKVQLHFTPTYSSWLNQVELWFAKIERDVIARGVFTSVTDLKRELMRYSRHYNKDPKTVKWKYFDPSRRITPESVVTVH
jgi:transposase